MKLALVEKMSSVDNSVIIAFDVNDSYVDRLHAKYGNDVGDLHMTLVYLGDKNTNGLTLTKDGIIARLHEFASTSAPIAGVFHGFARFTLDDGFALVLLYDSLQLPSFHGELRKILGYPMQDHGFTSHVTLAYGDMAIPNVAVKHDTVFDSISLYWGNEHIQFPLIGSVVYKQLPISDASKAALMEVRLNIFNTEVDALAEQLYDGNITIGAWEESMRSLIRQFHSSSAAIGKGGWDQMTQSDWGRLGQPIKDQNRYLHGFAEYIAENRDTVSLNAIKARAHMYGEASKLPAFMMQADKIIIKQLPWMPKDGSTECLVNCKCLWQLKVIATANKMKTVQAVWKLTPAEHCETCLGRKNYTVTFEVPSNMAVPPYIGGL